MLAFADEIATERPPDRTGRAAPARTPVIVVCSPRPRVGRTLIARLLVEYFNSDGRDVLAFDANPHDPMLSVYLPTQTEPANLSSTRGEMALFDRLIANDGVPKVIDLAPDLFDRFFEVTEKTGFVDDGRAIGIQTAALFVTERHPRAVSAHRQIVSRLPRMSVIPVSNAYLHAPGEAGAPLPDGSAPPIRIGALSPMLQGVVMRPGYSLSHYLERQAGRRTLLHDWIGASFVGFRDVELRLLMAEFAPLFRPAA